MSDLVIRLLQSSICFGTVIMYGAIGEILTEKSGNLNLGVPGIMYLGGIAGLAASFFYEFNNQHHKVFLSTTCCDGRSSEAYARCLECATCVVWHHVLVDGDVCSNESVFCHLTGEVGILRTEVYKHRVVVCATAHDSEAALDEFVGKYACVLLHLLCPLLELWLQSLAESHSLGSDDMLQRTALLSWEYCRVEQLAHHLCYALWCLQAPWVLEVLAHKDDATARTA